MTNSVHRDANGRFTTGNPGGPGRKPRDVEIEYLTAMEQVVSGEAWQAIVEKATADAIAGDAKARQWLSGYLLGMPVSRIVAEEPENALEKVLRQLNANMRTDE